MIKSERLHRKKVKTSSLPEPGDRGIQQVHQYRPQVRKREHTIGHAFYHPGYS